MQQSEGSIRSQSKENKPWEDFFSKKDNERFYIPWRDSNLPDWLRRSRWHTDINRSTAHSDVALSRLATPIDTERWLNGLTAARAMAAVIPAVRQLYNPDTSCKFNRLMTGVFPPSARISTFERPAKPACNVKSHKIGIWTTKAGRSTSDQSRIIVNEVHSGIRHCMLECDWLIWIRNKGRLCAQLSLAK